MTLNEWVQVKGNPTIIKGCSRTLLPEFFYSLGFRVGAEIGVYAGMFTEMFCQAGLKMYGIDPWKGYKGAGRGPMNQESQDNLYKDTMDRLVPYGDLAVIIRKTSEEALADIPDRSLDFIYIDGNHEFPFIAHDVYAWSRKVRIGGIISGHDYFNTAPHATGLLCHVKAAVDAYVSMQGINNWWVIGHIERKHRTHGGDTTPSWMWFNK